MIKQLAGVFLVAIHLSACAPVDPREAAVEWEITPRERENLHRNAKWMAERASTRSASSARAEVAVFADAGCWHLGTRSIVTALESSGISCEVIDRNQLNAVALAGRRVLILPGGWAPLQRAAAGPEGLAAIRTFAEGGGRVIGICGGAYLLSRTARWEGTDYPYPLGLFDGVAKGPLATLSHYPTPGPATLKITAAGRARGLEPLDATPVYYNGGAEYLGGSNITVLANYAGGGAAIIARRVAKGEIVLIGVHVERPAPADGGPDAPPPPLAGHFFSALVGK